MKFTAGKHVETSSILYCTEFSSKPCLIKRGRLKMSWNFPRLKRMIQIDENNFWVAQPPTSDCFFFLREEERMCHMAGKSRYFLEVGNCMFLGERDDGVMCRKMERARKTSDASMEMSSAQSGDGHSREAT